MVEYRDSLSKEGEIHVEAEAFIGRRKKYTE